MVFYAGKTRLFKFCQFSIFLALVNISIAYYLDMAELVKTIITIKFSMLENLIIQKISSIQSVNKVLCPKNTFFGPFLRFFWYISLACKSKNNLIRQFVEHPLSFNLSYWTASGAITQKTSSHFPVNSSQIYIPHYRIFI